MFDHIKTFFSSLWQNITSFFTRLFITKTSFTDTDKYNFVMYLLRGQKECTGFALRHVGSDDIKNTNISKGFTGDGISYSITPYIMSSVLNEQISTCFWFAAESGQMSYMTDTMSRPMVLDQTCAVKIFDCLHRKILQFIEYNFGGESHHYMLIKNMKGAALPYDIKDIYPTGKCGKQDVAPSQVVKVFSKSDTFNNEKKMLQAIESGVIELAKPCQYIYSKESTTAILTVLREIKFNADDKQLVVNDVHRRLIRSELDNRWSNDKYYEFYRGGHFNKFTESLPQINEDLEYFRALI